jgi:glycosyltransferase involved in cell wall biosynthesis
VRILYLADIRFPHERGSGVQTAETCHALARRGHEVTLVVRQDGARPPRDPLSFYSLTPCRSLQVVRLEAHGAPWRRRASYLRDALRLAAHGRHDVVFTTDLGVAWLALGVPRRLRPPVIYEAHGLVPVPRAGLGRLLREIGSPSSWTEVARAWRQRHVWKHADAFVTRTTQLRRELEAALGERHACYVVPDGVRLASPRQYEGPVWHRLPIVGYAGRLSPRRGADTLLRAVALVPNVRALVVGGAARETDLARLEGLARDLRIKSRVTFTGLVPPGEVPLRLARADVLVLPTTRRADNSSRTSPLALYEYLAAGRPIVASDLPALREVLTDGATALLVDPDSPTAFAGAIERLIADRRLAEALARRAFEAAGAYSWEERARRLGEVLASAAGPRR